MWASQSPVSLNPPAAAFGSAKRRKTGVVWKNSSSPGITERFKMNLHSKIKCFYFFFLQEKHSSGKTPATKKNALLWDYVQSLGFLAFFNIWRWSLLHCRKIHRSWNGNFDIKFPFQLNSSCLPDNSHWVRSISLSFSPDLWLKGFYFYRVKWEWVHS